MADDSVVHDTWGIAADYNTGRDRWNLGMKILKYIFLTVGVCLIAIASLVISGASGYYLYTLLDQIAPNVATITKNVFGAFLETAVLATPQLAYGGSTYLATKIMGGSHPKTYAFLAAALTTCAQVALFGNPIIDSAMQTIGIPLHPIASQYFSQQFFVDVGKTNLFLLSPVYALVASGFAVAGIAGIIAPLSVAVLLYLGWNRIRKANRDFDAARTIGIAPFQ
jgi:hypothetical protein